MVQIYGQGPFVVNYVNPADDRPKQRNSIRIRPAGRSGEKAFPAGVAELADGAGETKTGARQRTHEVGVVTQRIEPVVTLEGRCAEESGIHRARELRGAGVGGAEPRIRARDVKDRFGIGIAGRQGVEQLETFLSFPSAATAGSLVLEGGGVVNHRRCAFGRRQRLFVAAERHQRQTVEKAVPKALDGLFEFAQHPVSLRHARRDLRIEPSRLPSAASDASSRPQ